MTMPVLPHLHKQQPVSEMVHHLLKSLKIPHLDGEIGFTTRHNNPKRNVRTHYLVHLGKPGFLQIRDVNVALKVRRADTELQRFVQELDKPVNEMNRGIVALMN
jgi:hypothetical protein